MAYAEEQPKDGDVLLHCGHLSTAKRWHFYQFPEEIRFRRPDGTANTTEWLAVCAHCRMSLADPTMEAAAKLVRGDGVWHGNEPVITEPERS